MSTSNKQFLKTLTDYSLALASCLNVLLTAYLSIGAFCEHVISHKFCIIFEISGESTKTEVLPLPPRSAVWMDGRGLSPGQQSSPFGLTGDFKKPVMVSLLLRTSVFC